VLLPFAASNFAFAILFADLEPDEMAFARALSLTIGFFLLTALAGDFFVLFVFMLVGGGLLVRLALDE
jgi:hypothetical protein